MKTKTYAILFILMLTLTAWGATAHRSPTDTVCERADLVRTGMNTCKNPDEHQNQRYYEYTCSHYYSENSLHCTEMILWKH